MSALKELIEISETVQNPYIAEWVSQGKKVLGYFCNYVPEELIYAAGVLPFRMRAIGSVETTLGDSYLSAYNCSYARHCLDLAFRGEFKFLEGIVSMNGCDHVRRLYDIWRKKFQSPFLHFFQVPHKVTDGAPAWYRDEVAAFKQHLEGHFGVEITDERLRQAIRVTNESRRLLRRLYELRKADPPPLNGTEALAVGVASTAMPKEEFNRLIGRLFDEIDGRTGKDNYAARLMVVAANLDDPSLMQIIEDMGGVVVTDSSCIGSRTVWDLVDEEAADPLEAVAQRYLGQTSCARMIGDHERRLTFIKDMARDFHVDGIIFERLMFCDLWAGENEMIRRETRETNIPSLLLDREYKLSGVGQFKTRIQAFLEMIAG